MATKFVFVTGGVVSSLGKGIIAASLGRLLAARGFKVSLQKIEPYYNVDPSLLSPLQHGESFITDDGVAADLDLGHFERFTGVNLTGEASVTTGKIHKLVMERELRGEYKGGTVQVVPHVTNEIKQAIFTAAQNSNADIALVEVGGTVGDMESAPFLEAIRQMRWDMNDQDSCFIHVTLLPYISVAGELKTKPTQHSVKSLRSIGIVPDVIVCRTEKRITSESREKIALFCDVKASNVVQYVDAPSLYEVPLMMEEDGLAGIVCEQLGLDHPVCDLSAWKEMVERSRHPVHKAKIALVGKYVTLKEAYVSVEEALRHAGIALATSVSIDWINAEAITSENAADKLHGYDGIIVPGGFGDRGAEGIIAAAGYARTHHVPYLAIGLGMQLSVVEACRSLLHMPHANSQEIDPDTSSPVVYIPENRRTNNGSRSVARMGANSVVLKDGLIRSLYQSDNVSERHGNRYEVDAQYVNALCDNGFVLTGVSEAEGYPEAFEAKDHPFYAAVLYHPEFLSRPGRAHPLFVGFIQAASK